MILRVALAKTPPRIAAARWSISTVFFINGAGIGIWAVHIPLIQARLALDERMLGWVLLAIAGAAMVAMPLAGAVAGRLGTRRPTICMAIAFVFVTPLPIMAQTLTVLFAAALAFGASSGALDVLMNAHASEVEAARGKPTMSSFHAFYSAGGLAGAALGGVLIAGGLGDGRGAALAAGAAILVLWHIAPKLLPGSAAAAIRTGHFGWPRRAALLLGLLALLCMAVEGAVADWSALLLVQHTGASAASAALGYSAFSITMAACRFAGDGLILRFGARRLMMTGGVLIAIGLLWAATVPFSVPAAAGFALVGIGAANVVPVIFAAAGRVPGLSPGAGIATAATVGYAGFLLGPPLIGRIAAVTGLTAALGLLSAAGILIALSSSVVAEDIRSEEERLRA